MSVHFGVASLSRNGMSI